MLTKRTNILLSEFDHALLSHLASKNGQTIGELIRRAVRKTYRRDNKLSDRGLVLRQIDKLAEKINTRGINYRQLVEDGRKY